MRKFLPYILILIALVGLLSPTTTVLAQNTSTYTLLAPLPEIGDVFDASSSDNNSKLGEYLNLMIKLFIGICSVLAVIMIVMGGIEYMTSELMHSKEHGKERIRGAIFGLILALGAYTILYTINPDLLNTDFKSLESVTVEVNLNDSVPQTPKNGKYLNGATFGAPWPGTPSVLSGVAVNPPGDCATIGQPNCTSLKGLQVEYLNRIKAGCPSCQLTVTGGTEFWLHGGKTGSTSHGPGSPTIDLRITSELTQYITEGKELVYYKRYEKDGMSFLYEKSHWHVGP